MHAGSGDLFLEGKHSFGISIEPNWPVKYSTEIALLAEKLGFANVWVPDGGPMPPYSDAIVTLSGIAAVHCQN